VRSFIVWFFATLSLLYGVTTTEKIKDSQKNLNVVASQKKVASRKLEKIAEDIKAAEKEIDGLSEKIDILKADEEKTEKTYQALRKELQKSESALNEVNEDIKKKQEAFLKLAADQFSVIFAMQQFKTPTPQSIISYEVYQAYKQHNTQELHSLKNEIIILQQTQEQKRIKRDTTKNALSQIIKKREDYLKKKKEKEVFVKRLAADEESYRKRLNQIVDKQNSLRDTLAKLNIIQRNEAEEARRQAEAKKEAIRLEQERKRKVRLAQEKTRKAKLALQRATTQEARAAATMAAKKAVEDEQKVQQQSETVRKVNSSYKVSDIYAYRGTKTISPISGARVIKKFGTYVDPIYNIKIFNESITLQSPEEDVRVQNVLNGKVVFAGNSSMLGKVVVVAHSGRLHTVYAGLSKIAPNIEKGRNIKRGYVVGKVNRKLVFQATKDSKHIDPLKLISI